MEKTKVKIGIFALASLLMASLAISPSIASIAQNFPEASTSLVQMLLSVPSLASLVSALIVGKLSTRISKKTLCLTGIIFIIVGGIIPFFIHSNLYFLLFCSAILGFGTGTISTLNPSIIADNFDGAERGAIMGQMTAFASIGAMILIFLGGVLSVKGWEHNYLVYLVVILVFIIALICVPNAKPVQEQVSVENHQAKDGQTQRLNKYVFMVALVGFAFLVVYNAFSNNIALFISAESIGDSQIAGTASSIAQVGGLISGLFFGSIAKRLGKNVFSGAFLILGVGLLIVALTGSSTVVLVGGFVVGFSLSVYMAQAPFTLSTVVDGITFPLAMAVYSAITSIASFVSPIIINVVAGTFGDGSAKVALMSAAVISIAVAVIIMITNFQGKCIKKAETIR